MADPELVAAGTATSISNAGGYQLRRGSPAIAAGAVVADNGGRDFFGNPVSTTAAPDIGAYGGPGVDAGRSGLPLLPIAPFCG